MLLTRLFIILVLSLAGGGLIVAGIHPLRQLRASRGWVPVRGEVTRTGTRNWGSSHRIGANTLWGVVAEYEYQVDGHRYGGSRRYFTIWQLGGLHRPRAEEVAARFTPGAPIVVWHDPIAPSSAVLERGVDWPSVVTCLAIGALFALMALYYTLVLLGAFPAWE